MGINMTVIELMAMKTAVWIVGIEDLAQDRQGPRPAHTDDPDAAGAWWGRNGDNGINRPIPRVGCLTAHAGLVFHRRGHNNRSEISINVVYSVLSLSLAGSLVGSVAGLLPLRRRPPRDDGRFFTVGPTIVVFPAFSFPPKFSAGRLFFPLPGL